MDWYAGVTVVCFLLSAVYIWWTAGIIAGLFMLRPGRNRKQFTVSVIIPARNEEGTVGACLAAVLHQEYPAERFEVIVVDDRSTDGTHAAASVYAGEHANVRIIRIADDEPGIPGKKRAVACGIAAARNEVILITDADCRPRTGWISGMVAYFEPDTGVVAGATFFNRTDEKSIFTKLLSIENVALVAAGAGSIGAGRPSICNGSNLAYRRSVFLEVGGFGGIDSVASGDDDMFIQKVHALTAWKSAFAANPHTFNRTRPPRGGRAFLRQRLRWASKGGVYPDRLLSFYLRIMYVHYVVCCVAAVMAFLDPARALFLIFLLASKFAAEAVVAVRGCVLFGRKDLSIWVPLLGILFMPYVLAVSTTAMFRQVRWKE